MSGHSKWHKVRQFKGAIDAKRAASFTRLAREITVAAREKGSAPDMNTRLRAAITRAKEASMPKDNIERAITRGAGGGEEGEIETLTYEAYAPGGTALIIECLTDNRNRTASDVKHMLTKNGATLAASGAVTYLFDHVGVVRIPEKVAQANPLSPEVELALIDSGATDIQNDEGAIEIHCDPKDLAQVADATAQASLEADTVEFQWIPQTLIETNEEIGMAVAGLIEKLEENDDVSRVFCNLA